MIDAKLDSDELESTSKLLSFQSIDPINYDQSTSQSVPLLRTVCTNSF